MLEHPFPNGTKVRILSAGSNYKLSDPDGYIRLADSTGCYHISMLAPAQERDTFGRWSETTIVRVPAESVIPVYPNTSSASKFVSAS